MLISVAAVLEGREAEIAYVAGLAQPHTRKKIQIKRAAYGIIARVDPITFGVSKTCFFASFFNTRSFSLWCPAAHVMMRG